MRFLILSDSLALPRSSPEEVDLFLTWPYLLRREFKVEIVQSSIGGASSDDLLKQTFYYGSIKPEIVIVQCGIVDLAPRAFRPYELELLTRFRLTKYFLKKIREKKDLLNRIRNFRKVTYVSPRRFERNLQEFKRLFGKSLFWIGVPPSEVNYEKQIPGITKNITIYNNLIKKVLAENVIDLADFTTNEMMSDFHHLNTDGHERLANKIIERLRINHAIR